MCKWVRFCACIVFCYYYYFIFVFKNFNCFKGLVIAGIGDLQRPAEAISLPQTIALSATGLIWSRYSLVIIPKNYSLFSVNVFVAATQLYQMARAIK